VFVQPEEEERETAVEEDEVQPFREIEVMQEHGINMADI